MPALLVLWLTSCASVRSWRAASFLEAADRSEDAADVDRAFALDALIQTGGTAPESTLSGLRRRFPAQTTILLVRLPVRDAEASLSAMEQFDIGSAAWSALANRLLAVRSSAFARSLLRALPTRITLFKGDGPRVVTSFDWSLVSVPAPPRPTYALVTDPGPGRVLFSPGPQPVFYRRRIERPGLACGPGERSPAPGPHLLTYLRALSGVDAEALEVLAENERLIVGDGSIEEHAARLREEHRAAWLMLTAALAKNGSLVGTFPAPPALAIAVVDEPTSSPRPRTPPRTTSPPSRTAPPAPTAAQRRSRGR